MHSHDSQIDVRYAETDAMGIVHHGSYVVWMEVGRTEWLASLGYRYADFEQSGFFLVVTEIGLRYLKPARYGDTVRVRTHPSEIKSRAIRFEYEISNADSGERLATSFSRHVLTDHSGSIRTWPDYMLRLLDGL